MKKVAIFIILIGLALTIYTAVTFFTKEKIVEIGNVEISKNTPHYLNWQPVIGFVIMGIGGVLLWKSQSK